ncbi:hypothetical protein [Pseudoalteromonas tetraodonis]|uniref:hypothetical protein n=1 Tax=Pseudoalteromonas tetraodonis TaxID=43659 RepID=UPI003736508F
MKPQFEIKYIELKWYDKNTLVKVTESLNALSMEYDSVNQCFTTETTIYPKLDEIKRGQLAVRVLNVEAGQPYIYLPNNDKKLLTQIKDPDTGIYWWILKEKWVSEQKQWFGIAPNIVGTLKFYITSQLCEVEINGSDFSVEQLEQYLRVFKNDLWELILDDSSAVQANAKQTNGIGVSEEVIECINKIVNAAQKILETPKVELREIQAIKPRKLVKPVNRTFMEMVSKSNQRFLTSRATQPSYNVPENRYILFALERCCRVLKQIVILAQNKSQRFLDTANKLKGQLDSFDTSVKVNRDLVVKDLERVRERAKLEYWQKKLNLKIQDNDIQLTTTRCSLDLYLHLENKTQQKDGFFVLIWNGESWVKPDNKSGILSLRYRYQVLLEVLEPGDTLKFNCDYNYRTSERAVLFNLDNVHSIELIDCQSIQKAKEAFEKEKLIGKSLAKNGWVKPLSHQEIEEQNREKASLLNRINYYSQNQEISEYIYKRIEPKYRELRKLIQHMKGHGIMPSSHFPNSMTFVQNINYQAVHNGYKVLRDITKLTDDELLLNLEQIDDMGLVNMPLLYERWTLIQLILVLKGSFRFVPQKDWKYKLIEAVKSNKTDININLINDEAKRYISLWYEKSLSNNKRPDFILDLTWFSHNIDGSNERHFKRFVLDAKFYDKLTFDRAGGMLPKINELFDGKNYSENNSNPVFLIHPCNNLIEHPITAQSWGKHSFLGELNINDDVNLFSHDRGAVFLNPIDRSLYSDELQRLLGMFLQYKLEDAKTSDLDNDSSQAVPICIRCGSSDIKNLKKTTRYRNRHGDWVERTPKSVWMQCCECEQLQIYNHCASDKSSTRLIKNGLYWSYHSARALEPRAFRILCQPKLLNI